MKQALTVSIIIPVYNEGRYLKECLEAISLQSVSPLEVIVIDNNSTDDTAKIAKSFSFVTFKREKKQGLIPTRNHGFRVAKGDILARLDGDTVLPENWIRDVQKNFNNPLVGGTTGPGRSILEPHLPDFHVTFWPWVYRYYAQAMFGYDVMWGANMAIRRQAWLDIQHIAATEDPMVHEDQDLSTLITAAGYNILYDKALCVTMDGYRSVYLPKALEYERRARRTIFRHKANGQIYVARHLQHSNLLRRKLLGLSLMPFGLLYGVLSAMYSLEVILHLRKLH